MRRFLLIIAVLFVLLAVSYGQLFAQSGGETRSMQTANQLYENGQFADAAALYQQLVDQGIENDALYFNLGNAYFKSEDVGRAILSYRKAAQIDPRDDDIQNNLKIARSQRTDQYDQETDFLTRLTQMVGSWLTLDELALIALGLWFISAILLIAFFLQKAGRTRTTIGYTLLIVGFSLIVSISALGSELYVHSRRPAAVIIEQEVNVMGGPGSGQVVEFTLHSGAEVHILEERGSWMRLELPGGNVEGWVPQDVLEKV